jgi:hypothetical protein
MIKNMFKLKFFLAVSTLIVLPAAIWAWTEPASSPPGGNVPVPLNTGSTSQTKAGALTVSTLTVSSGKAYLSVSAEGDLENVNSIVGYNDLFLKSNAAENQTLYLSGSDLQFWSGGALKWKIDSSGSLVSGSVPPTRLPVFDCGGTKYIKGVDASGWVCDTPQSGGGGQVQDAFKDIASSTGQVQFSAQNEDKLRFAAGSNVSIAFDAPTKKITFSALDTRCDASGICSQVCIGADCRNSWPGGLQGGGTTNYAAKFTASGTLGNSQIFDNGSQVGIGTASPGQKLTVAGTIESTSGGFKFPDGTTQTTAAALPTGTVIFYDGTSCPAGWAELIAARGRYLVGLPSGGTLSGSVGTALTNLQNRAAGQHTHSLSGSTSSDGNHQHPMYMKQDAGGNREVVKMGYIYSGGQTHPAMEAAGNHNHSISGNTDSGSSLAAGTNAPYLQLLVCRKN